MGDCPEVYIICPYQDNETYGQIKKKREFVGQTFIKIS
jgi:hypothetical protein